MITFNQLLFVALALCVVGPIVWTIMTAVTYATWRTLVRRHIEDGTSATTWLGLRGFLLAKRPGLDSKYAQLQAVHDIAEIIEIRLDAHCDNEALREHYRELHAELCAQLRDEPGIDSAVALREENEWTSADVPPDGGA